MPGQGMCMHTHPTCVPDLQTPKVTVCSQLGRVPALQILLGGPYQSRVLQMPINSQPVPSLEVLQAVASIE